MSVHWRLLPSEPADIERLAFEAKVAPLVARLLWNRGLRDGPSCREFLDCRQRQLHDPELLPGAVEAASRLAAAVRDGRKIVVYGDYDVDGVCGTSILWEGLRLAGATTVDYYIPHRVEEGYGLNPDALRALRQDHGAEVIVTVDCGITAVAEARLARELGLELIITDHHTFQAESLPAADVLVHPRLPGGGYPFGELCGAGVAFKVAWQLAKSFGDGKKASPHLREYLVRALNLVALATVADVVPLEGENRIFVRHGLLGLGRDPSVGLQSLLEVAGCAGKPKLNSGHLGFHLGPRINAAGRMEKARAAVEMLTTTDAARAAELAAHLETCNRQRQEIQRSILAEAKQRIDAAQERDRPRPSGIVVAQEGWHTGVIGIVAGRVAETYHRPTIILSIDGEIAQGSGRSVTGFDLHAALVACRDGLIRFGGHKAAAGLKLPASLVGEFASRFDAYCAATLTDEQRRRELVLDAEVRLGELTYDVVTAVESLEPYGISNPRPLLLVEGAKLLGPPRLMGKQQEHMSFRIEQGGVARRAVAWGMARRAEELMPGAYGSFVFTPSINEWNGRAEVQLEVRDFAVDEPAVGSGHIESRPVASPLS